MSERIRSMQIGVDKVLALEARVAELEAENTKLREGAFSKAVASEVEEALRDRIAADTALTDKSKGDTPLGYVRIESLLEAFENLSFVRQQLTDAKQQLEETKWECRNLEAERDEARRELAEAEKAIRMLAPMHCEDCGGTGDLWHGPPDDPQQIQCSTCRASGTVSSKYANDPQVLTHPAVRRALGRKP